MSQPVEEMDEAELAWQKQQEELMKGNPDGDQVEPTEGDDDEDDEEAERMWQMMQAQLLKENEEARKLDELRMQNELNLSNADDDDGIYHGELNIPFESLVFEQEPLAGGNFGKIFKGDFLGTEVAIKKFAFEEDAKYVEREVAVLKAIRHPNIVTFLGVSQNQGALFVVTELVAKGDLTKELQRDKPISWRQRVLYAKDTCAAIAYLHQLGIIHRDIKPDNLLITDNLRIKVCDLGFARTAKKTKRMSIAGTSLYMAPEVMVGDQYNDKCDVFSFGTVIMELMTRKPPPTRSVDNMYLFDFDEIRGLAPPDCPPELLDICLDCIQPNPDDRPMMKDLIPRLSKLLTTLPSEEDEQAMTEEERRLEEEAEKAFLLEAEKSLRENQKFLEAVKEIEAEAKMTPEDLELAKAEMEKKMKEEIEKEVQQRLQEEKRRLRQEMEKELESSKARLTASMSATEMRKQLMDKARSGTTASSSAAKKRNSLNLEEIQQVREELKKEEKAIRKEDKQLKKAERRLSRKKKQETITASRLSWGPARLKKESKNFVAEKNGDSNHHHKENGGGAASDDEEMPPWKTAVANGMPKDNNNSNKKEPQPSASKEVPKDKKETKKEKKEREKEEKKEKERLRKEKKEREKQEKMLRAEVKKKKAAEEKAHHKKEKEKEKEKAAKGVTKPEKIPSPRKDKDKGKLDDHLRSSNSSVLYG